MKPITHLVYIASLLFLPACSGITPYQPMGYGGGYSEQKVGEGSYKLTCRGNGVTGLDTVEAICLRRAAELLKADGYTHFSYEYGSSHEDSSSTVDTSLGLSPRKASTTLTPMGMGQYQATTTFSGGPTPTTMEFRRYWVRGMARGHKPGMEPPGAYSVEAVLSSN